MTHPLISLIAAISKTRVLGNSKGQTASDQIPWKIPTDMQFFRQKTTGHVVIMGRTTYQSMGKPLPNRTNLVVTRDPDFQAIGVTVCHSIEEAIQEASEIEQEEIFVIGGGQVYQAALPLADTLYLTIVEGEYEGDVFFPEYESLFRLESKSELLSDNNYSFTFEKYLTI